MRWSRTGGSDIEDRRGMPVAGIGGGMGVIGLIIALLFGGNVLGGGNGGGFDVPSPGQFPSMPAASGNERPTNAPDAEADLVAFLDEVAKDVQNSWERVFQGGRQPYERTKLVVFEQAVNTGCGSADASTGPFYCPADHKLYLDLGFFRELRDRFRAPGDFAQAYVVAHEFGHHVQNILGINEDVRRQQQRNPDDANELSVRMELQADCLAGVWAHSAYNRNVLESGDLEEGLSAAAAVGDDRIQREATGRVQPESFTHGTSEQRQKWFREGFDSGDINSCNTFK